MILISEKKVLKKKINLSSPLAGTLLKKSQHFNRCPGFHQLPLHTIVSHKFKKIHSTFHGYVYLMGIGKKEKAISMYRSIG